ncbi:hypothetical protein Dda_3409 [Drechslerella dactyloides]|uniref:Uncharacterized protein n=1 Tax=Drechslerella dactyloides TaxID=74499 RepID=A0AAD6NMT7_DREDA|nr:hypothetical protein Dda_3409 [Drechslerella dactyloides]
MLLAAILPALCAILLQPNPTNGFPFDAGFPEKLNHHHILAIRDAPSHVPVQAVNVRPGVLLSHLQKLNPRMRPTFVETRGKFNISQWSFNSSMWNVGLADYLSHPRVLRTVKLSDAMERMKTANGSANTITARDTRFFTKDWQPFDLKGEKQPQEVKPMYAENSNAKDKGFSGITIKPRASHFTEGVYMRLDEMRETANTFCGMFDAHMYKFAIGSTDPGLIKQFSIGTIYKAVKLEDKNKAQINFVFNFHPSYSWTDKHYWYSMSIFTGIQGMCWRFMANFLTKDTAPDGVVGGADPPDSRGGWMGFGNGKDGNSASEAAWRVRWAIDPYVPGSDEESTPKEGPGEADNGLPAGKPN